MDENCERAVAGLGRLLGIEGLGFDPATGTCALAFDDRVTVHLAVQPARTGLLMFTTLGACNPTQQPELAAALLRANYLWRGTEGATLSLDPVHDVALLAQALAATEVQAEMLERQLTHFVETAFAWGHRLRAG